MLPANTPAFDSHMGATVAEVYAPGRWNSHLSDFVAAFAIMHDAATRQAPTEFADGSSCIWGKRGIVPSMFERILPGPYESAGHRVEIRYTGGGMGNPGSYTSACACGWLSTWEELRGPIDSPIEKMGFVQHFVDEVRAAASSWIWWGLTKRAL
jgi:hypothetical protein